jgi:signal peptidase I
VDKRAKIAIAIAVFSGALLVGSIAFQFLVRSAAVYDSSMEPTLPAGTTVTVPVKRDVARGTIIAFRGAERFRLPVVQRVIAVGGDTVELDGNVVRVNGKPLDEPYVKLRADEETPSLPYTTTVLAGHYFVLADNRSSEDHRKYGQIRREDVIGPAVLAFRPRRGIWRPR